MLGQSDGPYRALSPVDTEILHDIEYKHKYKIQYKYK